MAKAKSRFAGSPSLDKEAKIIVVDDHPLVRKGLAELIEEDPSLTVVGETGSASDAMRMATQLQPDLMVVDISLEDMNGIELIKQIRAYSEQIKVLVSSMHDESLFAERALQAGAMGYLRKTEPPETLVVAIKTVLNGEVFLSTNMTNRMLQRIRGGEQPEESTSVEKLSDRELEVFQLIGQGLTTRDVAERLHLSPKTVETYREHIKEKLQLKNSTELIRHAVWWSLRSSGAV